MIDRVVTLAGPPGSGKSTAGRLLAEVLHLEFRSAGELFRAQAAARGMDVGAFSRYAEQHEEIDRGLDAEMAALARPGRLLDGRLVGALARRAGTACHYLVVTCEAEERYRRLSQRDRVPLPEARARTLAREASERDRYRRYYGIDLDTERPDLSVDSTRIPANEVMEQLRRFLAAPGAGRT